MKKRFATVALATTTIACAMMLSADWSGQGGVTLSTQSAEARVGRPLTPVSVAGVARRQARRATYGYGYGAGAVGAGLAIGAATVAAATSPWGYGDGAYAAYAATNPAWGGGGYYADSPWGYYDCRLPHTYNCQPYSNTGWYQH